MTDESVKKKQDIQELGVYFWLFTQKTIFQSLGSALGRRTAQRGSKRRTTWFSYLLQRFGSKCFMSRFIFSPCWMQRNEIFMRYVDQVAAWLRLNSKIK